MKKLQSQNQNKKRLLTGERPTGPLHLGHLIGSLLQRVELQDKYESFIIVADVQALTDNFDNPEKVKLNTLEVVLDNLAVGVDPNKVTFFIQSQIPAIAELFVYFSNLVSVDELARNPTVKSELREKALTKKAFKNRVPFGFFSYPLHQCADILCVNADLVPVGEDQLPMIELCRTVARRFNKIYKTNLFHIPEARLSHFPRLVGIDGNAKMSKSLDNCIYLSDDEETLKAKVFKMYTDPNRIHATDPGRIEGNVVFIYHDAFNPNKEEVEDLKERYKKGRVGDIEVKERLFFALNNLLAPIRERRKFYEKRKDEVMEILFEGSKKVRRISNEILAKVKEVIKVTFSCD